MIGFGQDGPFYFTDTNNIQREFYLHMPNNLPSNSPIVYVFHGHGGSGASIMSTTAFNLLADQNNFAVCYPAGLIDGSGLTAWDVGGFSDIDFIQALNDSLHNEHQFDVNKVFATGFSYGAEMSYHLASCQTSNMFAAIATVGGAMWDFTANSWPVVCTPSVGVSVFILNGTNDNVFDYNGGYYTGVGEYLSVDSAVSYWVNYGSCVLNSSYILADVNNDGHLTEVTKYNNTSSGDKIWLYKVNNGTHTWFDVPAWGNDDFWASEDIWNFFVSVSSGQAGVDEVDNSLNRNLLKTINVLGQEIQSQSNSLLFNVYNDGTVEKKMIID